MQNETQRYINVALLSLVISCVILGTAMAETTPALGSIPESRNQIIKLTDHGVEPRELHMKLEDSIVFFLNETGESLVTLQIDYGKKETHCASSNLEIAENGVVRSRRPFSPKDFASVCFHDKGSYPLKVYGLKSNPKEVEATIVVE